MQDILILQNEGFKEMLRMQESVLLRCGNQVISLADPLVMGVINATPDSFYSGSRTDGSVGAAVEMAGRMIAEGATILDIGGMSSRPGSDEIPVGEELIRVIPVIEAIHQIYPEVILSVDTYRAEVAKACIKAGATMVNDISGGQFDPDLLRVVAEEQVAYVFMHTRGKPLNMQNNTDYQCIIADLLKYFVNGIRNLERAGVHDIVIDPGFGFAKTMEQNYQLMAHLDLFRFLHLPVMVGISRKSTLSRTIGRPVEETLFATTALHMAALQNGASILRVHDVVAAMDTISVYRHLEQGKTLNNISLSPG